MRPTLMQFHPALRRSLVFILPLAVLLAAILARVAISNILDRLSLICFDFYQRAAPREAGEAPIRIVDIDDDSLAKVGQWPWPRATIAQLIDRLRDAGAAGIAFDIDFAEPDRTSPELLLPMLTRSGVDAAAAQRLLAPVADTIGNLRKRYARSHS
jgi:adenylate cyclase